MAHDNTSTIEYPSEIHRLLKIGGPSHDEHIDRAVEEPTLLHDLPTDQPAAHTEHTVHAAPDVPVYPVNLETMQTKSSAWKMLFIYPAVFLVAFMFFYVVLNFSALFAQVQSWFIKPQEEVQLGAHVNEYYAWIQGYYFTVNDTTLLDPYNDIDKDGLSNMDEFIMRTNPVLADSDSDGFTDGTEVINHMNPWGSGPETKAQKKLAEGLDPIMVNNRIGYNASQNTQPGQVAGVKTVTYDISKPGKLSIPRLGIQVPLIWSADPANFVSDLNHGVIHYPGTVMPGEVGISYISGHSSDYIWKRNPYGNIFATLNRLQPGDDVFVEAYGIDGKTYSYRYEVVSSATVTPDDQSQFVDTSGQKLLNLSTCWPIGTQKDRLVVTAVEKPL